MKFEFKLLLTAIVEGVFVGDLAVVASLGDVLVGVGGLTGCFAECDGGGDIAEVEGDIAEVATLDVGDVLVGVGDLTGNFAECDGVGDTAEVTTLGDVLVGVVEVGALTGNFAECDGVYVGDIAEVATLGDVLVGVRGRIDDFAEGDVAAVASLGDVLVSVPQVDEVSLEGVTVISLLVVFMLACL